MEQRYRDELARWEREGLRRRMMAVNTAAGRLMCVQGEEKIVFCSNNYLGLANHPQVIAAIKKGLGEWGYGAGGSRLICGNTIIHEQLQHRLAQWLGKEACLIFPSGYMTNHAVLSALPDKGDLVLIDKLVHASIIDGARASAATVRTWPHKQTEKLKRLLDKGGYRQAFIVTDSIFSMDGDLARLEELVELKQRYKAILIVDEAHAFGCIGPGGKGCAAQAGAIDEVDVFVATFSKALGGAGGFAASSKTIADYLINRARGFIYTTAIPVVNCLAAQAALDVIAAEPQRRERLLSNAEHLRRSLCERGLDIGASESYIVPVIIGEADKTLAVSRRLWEQGFMVPAIRPPTVARGGSRLRVSVMSDHTTEDIDRLSEQLGRIAAPKFSQSTQLKGP